MKGSYLLLLVTIFFFIACKPSFKVQSDLITRKDLSNYTSFKFFNPDNLPKSNFAFSEANKKQIFDATAYELKTRGYASHQKADLIIKIQGGTSKDKESVSSPRYNNYGGYNTYNSYYWRNDPWLNDDISKKSTTIIIDVLDAETKKLLWQGVGTGVLGDKEGEVELMLNQSVADIFNQYPVKPISDN